MSAVNLHCESMKGRPVIPSIRGKFPFGERNVPGGVPSIDGPGGLNCYRSTLSLLYNRLQVYALTLMPKIFSKKYFLYPPKIRSAIENINYFHISGNFLATYTLYIVTHAVLAYSPQRPNGIMGLDIGLYL